MDIEDLKKDYRKFEKKYKLPSFRKLNEIFEIEKLNHESETLLRSVRKHLMEKIVNSLSFVEMLLNPVNAPRMYQGYVKLMTTEDKEILEEIYKKFAELVVKSLEREISYGEKTESELIVEIHDVWKDVAKNFEKIFIHIRNPARNFNRKERSYFG